MEGCPHLWRRQRYLPPFAAHAAKENRRLRRVHHGIVVLRQTPYEDELEDLRWYPSQRGNQRLVCAPDVVQLRALLGNFLQCSFELGDTGIVLCQFMVNAGYILFDFGDLRVTGDVVRV